MRAEQSFAWPESLARQLRQRRSALGLTQEDLADRSGVAVRTISDIERGRSRFPHRHTLGALADALGLTAADRERFIAAGREGIQPGPVPTDQPGPPRPPRLLPRDITSFTGREAELERLTAAVRDAGTGGLFAIDGMGGVGKTTLALRAAHQLADRYPDGQLYLDLRGYTTGLDPLTPAEALASMLRSLGVPDHAIPDDPAARAAVYRSRLAGTRTLVVLDSAVDAAQVRPLLPGTSGCLVIVTSRRKIQGLDDAEPVSLDVLSEPDAVALFRRIAGQERAGDDPAAVTEAVRLCGFLPLAIRIVAARLRQRGSVPVEAVTAQLRQRRRLADLSDDDRSLAAVFDISLRQLPAGGRRMFLLAGLVPGPDFDLHAAAALDGGDGDTALRLLESLVDNNLLGQPARGRFRLHDLARVHARGLLTADPPGLAPGDRDAAITRVLDYYLSAALAADRCLERRLPDVAFPAPAAAVAPAGAAPAEATLAPSFDGPQQARAWLAAELPSLEAAVRYCLGHDRYAHAVALSAALAHYLRAYGPWAVARTLDSAVAAAADARGDARGAAGALAHRGVIARQTGALAEADSSLRGALDRYRALGDRRGQAGVLVELGIVQRLTGEHDAAEAGLRAALDTFRGLADPRGEAAALAEIGSVLRQRGMFTEAEEALTRAHDRYRAAGNRTGEASTLAYLGGVQWARGALDAAAESLTAALEINRDLGDPTGEANCLLYLGGVHRDTGALGTAAEHLSAALRAYTGLGDRRGRAGALAVLGSVTRQAGDDAAAARYLSEALDLFRELNDAGGLAETLNNYAALLAAAGDAAAARERYTECLVLARHIAAGKDEADALTGIAHTYGLQGDAERAAGHFTQALTLYKKMNCAADADRVEAALAALRRTGLPAYVGAGNLRDDARLGLHGQDPLRIAAAGAQPRGRDGRPGGHRGAKAREAVVGDPAECQDGDQCGGRRHRGGAAADAASARAADAGPADLPDEPVHGDDGGGVEQQDGDNGVPGAVLGRRGDRQHGGLPGRGDGRDREHEPADQRHQDEDLGRPRLREQRPAEDDREEAPDDQRAGVHPHLVAYPPRQVPADRGQDDFVTVERGRLAGRRQLRHPRVPVEERLVDPWRLHERADRPADGHAVLAQPGQRDDAQQQQRREDEGERVGDDRGEPDQRREGDARPRPRAPQDRPEQREQQVPARVHAAVGDLHRRDGQQHDGQAKQAAQPRRADMPGAGAEDEQRARGRDDRAGDGEEQRRVRQRQHGRALADQLLGDRQVPVVRRQQVRPGVLQRLDEVGVVVVGVDAGPGGRAGYPSEQHQGSRGERGDVGRDDHATLREGPFAPARRLREQLADEAGDVRGPLPPPPGRRILVIRTPRHAIQVRQEFPSAASDDRT